MFRLYSVLLALICIVLFNMQAAWGIVEFRKWSPKGSEPFYASAEGFSPDESELVLKRHDTGHFDKYKSDVAVFETAVPGPEVRLRKHEDKWLLE